MNEGPKVSVIIIFLNGEAFIEEAIQSVFGQTCDSWELLLVDDGSDDHSTEIALRYANQFPERVRYCDHPRHENRGMSASRNLGIRHARGEYIAFLDADDVWLAKKLERQLAIFSAYPEIGMVYGSPELWYSWTRRAEDRGRDCLQPVGVDPNTVLYPPALLARYLSRQAITPAPSDVLLRRVTVASVGGFEDSFRGMYEDQVFFAKVCLKSPVLVAGECWDRHRQHPNSACSVWRRTGEYYSAEASLNFLNWIEQYLNRQDVTGSGIRRILQKALLPYRHPLLYRLIRKGERVRSHIESTTRQTARRILPTPAHRWLRARWHGARRRPATVDGE